MKIKSLKFKSVNSTNDIALDLIKKNKFKPTLISAEQQIKGRGTMGKKWVSLKGNLFLSIIFEIDEKKISVKQFTILNVYLLKKVLKKRGKKRKKTQNQALKFEKHTKCKKMFSKHFC